MTDVRDHLVQMMEALNDKEVDPQVIERAKALSALAAQYTESVKVHLSAAKMVAESGIQMPAALEHKP
jgi:hypothetical protein